jgi:hypothetical protein
LANFYYKFIKGLLQLVKPLSNLFKKKLSFKWKEEQQMAFEDLKSKLSFTLVLRFPNFTKPFEIHTDANDFAIGGVFMQDGHLITFKSKKICGAQLQWPTREKELYTVMCCLKMWQHYLGTHKTKV